MASPWTSGGAQDPGLARPSGLGGLAGAFEFLLVLEVFGWFPCIPGLPSRLILFVSPRWFSARSRPVCPCGAQVGEWGAQNDEGEPKTHQFQLFVLPGRFLLKHKFEVR